MPSVHDYSLEILQDVLSQPTAPYHEERVAAHVTAYLREWGIPFTTDEDGNIIARYQHGAACRPLVLMAHMDHPGLTIGERDQSRTGVWTATLEGGVTPAYFQQPVAVRVHSRAPGAPAEGLAGRITDHVQDAASGVRHFALHIDDPRAAELVRPGDFGTWDLVDYEIRDGFIHARALDDLVGCAELLLTLWQAVQAGWNTDLFAVFTRAEEVGLVGAHAVLRSELLPRDAYLISLEASAALPGAIQGGGPVIRVGDRLTTFSQDAELLLKIAAHHLGATVWQPSRGRVAAPARAKVQRQLMSGGMCEASAAVMLGYQATGLAIPLGNYHNMGENSVLAAETIHVDDYLTGIALLAAAAQAMPEVDSMRAEHYAAYAPAPELLERLRQR